MNNMRLTMSKARDLIKRELGISGAALEKPIEMNSSPKYPWYTMDAGNMFIRVCTPQLDRRMVELTIGFPDGLESIRRYYYCDDLSAAVEFTAALRWEDIFEIVDEVSRDTLLVRLNRDSREACQKHFDR